jgi:hypothetical protein
MKAARALECHQESQIPPKKGFFPPARNAAPCGSTLFDGLVRRRCDASRRGRESDRGGLRGRLPTATAFLDAIRDPAHERHAASATLTRRRPAGERHGTDGRRRAGLAIHRGHSPGRAGRCHIAAARADAGRPGSVTSPSATAEPASQSAAVTPLAAPGSVTSPPHEPTPAGRPGSVTAPPATAFLDAIRDPAHDRLAASATLTRRRSASRPEAAGSSAARSSCPSCTGANTCRPVGWPPYPHPIS